MEEKRLKVVKVDSEGIEFEKGFTLTSDHQQDCCEHHYLSFDDLTLKDFEGLEFDLSNDDFFRRIEDFGIELIPINGWSIRVPGYGYNNGYYSHELTLVIGKDREPFKQYNISECQVVDD